jgi:hypothetical protein
MNYSIEVAGVVVRGEASVTDVAALARELATSTNGHGPLLALPVAEVERGPEPEPTDPEPQPLGNGQAPAGPESDLLRFAVASAVVTPLLDAEWLNLEAFGNPVERPYGRGTSFMFELDSARAVDLYETLIEAHANGLFAGVTAYHNVRSRLEDALNAHFHVKAPAR